MPGCAACGDHNALDFEQLLIGDVQAAKPHGPFFLQQAATHRVTHTVRLFHDLFEHEMGVAAALDCGEIPFHLRHGFLFFRRGQVHDAIVGRRDFGDFAVIEIHDRARVGEHGGRIGRHPVFSVADRDEQRRSTPRCDERVRLAARDDGDAVGTFHLT